MDKPLRSRFIIILSKTALTRFLQAEDVFALSNTFPDFNNLLSADEWKVCASELSGHPFSRTFLLGVWKTFIREAACRKIALLYCC